jgi:hypothetical protein
VAGRAQGGSHAAAAPEIADVNYTVAYSYGGAIDPINADGSSIYNLNRTIPLRLKVLDSAGAMVPGLAPRLYPSKLSNSVWGTELEALSTNAPDSGNTFLWLNASSGHKFNLATKPLSVGTWRLRVELGTAAPCTRSSRCGRSREARAAEGILRGPLRCDRLFAAGLAHRFVTVKASPR